MKISDLNSAALASLTTASIASSAGMGAYGRASKGAYGPTPDQVQLSGASRIASSALAAHSARLTELKSLVAAGKYNPSAEAVSQAIVSDALSRSS